MLSGSNGMANVNTERLRILVANEVADRLDLVADTVIALGHERRRP